MITTLAVIALAGGLGSGVIPSTPNWQADYAQAMTRASEERKPMAVFIGHGPDTVQKLVAEGKIPSDVSKLLRDRYVCLYLDADTAKGKELAGLFEISEGLVISGPGGTTQAYRHNGTVATVDLTKPLTQYAGAGQPTTTVTSGAPSIRYNIVPANGQYVIPGGYTYPNSGIVCTGFR